jgi:imidazolonepropionase-like amidohydrolase
MMAWSLAAAMIVWTLAQLAVAQTVHRFSVLSNGHVVGHLTATIAGDSATIDFSISDNGRGPKLREQVILHANGIPKFIKTEGHSTTGASVQEEFKASDGVAHWSSRADSGSAPTVQPALYITNDETPWDLGVYARALLKAPGLEMHALPSGTIKLRKIKDFTFPSKERPIEVTAYEISGIQLSPQYILLDDKGDLFADLSSETIRDGYERDGDELHALESEFGLARQRMLQAKLAHRFDQPVRIVNAYLFDPGSGMRKGPVSVVAYRGRISAVLPYNRAEVEPTDEVLIDAEGGTILPGLRDMHSHTSIDSGLFYLAAGVTSTRDKGNDNRFLQDLIPRLESGEIAGPRVTPDGFIEGKSEYSAHDGFVIDNLAEGLQDVGWYADRGYHSIKIYNSMNPVFIAPLAAEAHRRGMGVTGHVPAFTTPDFAIENGYDEITHINLLMFGWVLNPDEDTRTILRIAGLNRLATIDLTSQKVQHTIALMQAHRTAMDTTAVIEERLMLSRMHKVLPADQPYVSHIPIGYQRYLMRNFVETPNKTVDQQYVDAAAKMLAIIKLLHDKGIQLLPGTDDDTGFTVHRELELYVQAGISPSETLTLATLAAARRLGQDSELGSIERGKYSDLILVPGDPTRNISDIRKIRMVMKGAAIYFPQEIYQELGIQPFVTPPPIRKPQS